MIKIPAAILNSLDKNNNIFPTAEAVAPKTINTSENPMENKIVFIANLLEYYTEFNRELY